MGPILFAILLNSIPTKFSNSKLICYADDTTLLHSVAPGEPDHLQSEIELESIKENGDQCEKDKAA